MLGRRWAKGRCAGGWRRQLAIAGVDNVPPGLLKSKAQVGGQCVKERFDRVRFGRQHRRRARRRHLRLHRHLAQDAGHGRDIPAVRIPAYPKLSDLGSQKSPSSPRPAKIPRISSGCGRREFSCSRVEYQVVASVQSWSILTSGRIGYPCTVHHCRTRSSDRKKSMLLQVKTISSHHLAAGTRQWKSQVEGSGPSRPTSR